MKKIILSAIFAAGSFALFAQDKTNQANNTTTHTTNQAYNATSTATYNAYGVPDYVQWDFQTDYPGYDIQWMQGTTDWYHGYFMNNNRYTHTYYSTDPYYNVRYYPERITGYTVSLPVLQTYVPDEVVSVALNMHKQNLYDITAMKGADKQDMYMVRVMENGQLRTLYMDAQGTAMTHIYRTDEVDNTAHTSTLTTTESHPAMNDTKTKVKAKKADGTEIKTKTKNGKTKTKVSGKKDGHHEMH